MSWPDQAWRAIDAAHASLPEGVTFKQRKAAIDSAYPFGTRAHWPYKAWLAARRAYLARWCDQSAGPLDARPEEQEDHVYEYVRGAYRVRPRIGQRVQHTETLQFGTIAPESPSGRHYVMVRFDGRKFNSPCHPLALDYSPSEPNALRQQAGAS